MSVANEVFQATYAELQECRQRIAELEQEKDQIERNLSHMKCNWMQYESAKVKEARAEERERLRILWQSFQLDNQHKGAAWHALNDALGDG